MASCEALARPYARALFDLARDDDTVARWSETLDGLAAQVAVPAMAAAVRDPTLPRSAPLDVLLETVGEFIDRDGRNLLRLLAERRRLALLPAIATVFNDLRADDERRGTVHVASARPLSAEQEERLRRTLETSLDRRVTLACEVDDALLGGAVIRIGDRVIDGSALGRLRELADRLV